MPNFPASLDSLANPTPTTLRNDPGFGLSGQISTLNDIAEALEAKLGIGVSVPAAGTVLRGTGPGQSSFGGMTATEIAAGTGLRKLVDTTLGAASNVINLPNISQAYADLRWTLLSSNTLASVTGIYVRYSFDGTTYDVTGPYDWVATNQGSASASSGAVVIADAGIALSSHYQSYVSTLIGELPQYAATGVKHAYARGLAVKGVTAADYTGQVQVGTHRTNLNPVKGLQFYVVAGQFAAGARLMLFGLPGTLG